MGHIQPLRDLHIYDSTFQEVYFLREKPRLQSNKTMQVRFLFFLAIKMPYLTPVPVTLTAKKPRR